MPSFMRSQALAIVALLALAACGGGALPSTPPVPGGSTTPGSYVVDTSSGPCAVSYDGFVWYSLPSGGFSPIDTQMSTCARASLGATLQPALPAWAIPHGATQTRFVATSLQEAYSLAGMQSMHDAAAPLHVPMSWMIGSFAYLVNAGLYRSYHAVDGDDVEAEHNVPLIDRMKQLFPFYVPTVSIEGAGHERNIAGLPALGEHAFWGITWNSHGVDGTYDYGAPWGSYCADPSSYKRPDPNGKCPLLAFEWTARDLTRAYLSGHEEYFSTDPDDLQVRAQFSVSGAQAYIRSVTDAYAAAGETQPIVMMSQQESDGNTPGDADILQAMYSEAIADGMKLETLAQAAADARTFSAAPRAAAFPYIPGGVEVPSSIVNGSELYPATIDYHDALVGMSFLSGHTLPTRVFRYADYPHSAFNVPLPTLPASMIPTLTSVSSKKGKLALAFQAPAAIRFGIALWSSPAKLAISYPGAIVAGRAGVVVVFDLQQGPNQVVITCGGCKGKTFTYST